MMHTCLLYISGLSFALIGCLSIYSGYQLIPDQPSPRHFVGLPLVVFGIGLILRLRFIVWTVSVLSILYFLLISWGQVRQFALFDTAIQPLALFLAFLALAYGITMIMGLLPKRTAENDISA